MKWETKAMVWGSFFFLVGSVMENMESYWIGCISRVEDMGEWVIMKGEKVGFFFFFFWSPPPSL
jgi:hypothetical protein